MESERQIVVAGEIDVVAAPHAEGACVNRLDIDKLPPQCLAREAIEKGLVPAFASRHHPVLAGWEIDSNQNAKPVSDITESANPINGQASQAKGLREPKPAHDLRHDFESGEVLGLLTLPLLDLVDRARAVHRRHHEDGEVQLASLLSIKTGACPEDCKYCPQSAHYAKETGLKRETLLDVDDVLAKARLARQAGATRFCMGAAWREVKDGPAFDSVLAMVSGVRALDMEACVTLGMLNQSQAAAPRRGWTHRLQPQSRHLARVLRRDHHHPDLSGPARHHRLRAGRRHRGLLRRHHRHGRDRRGPGTSPPDARQSRPPPGKRADQRARRRVRARRSRMPLPSIRSISCAW